MEVYYRPRICAINPFVTIRKIQWIGLQGVIPYHARLLKCDRDALAGWKFREPST